jgi:hypothetical protein
VNLDAKSIGQPLMHEYHRHFLVWKDERAIALQQPEPEETIDGDDLDEDEQEGVDEDEQDDAKAAHDDETMLKSSKAKCQSLLDDKISYVLSESK